MYTSSYTSQYQLFLAENTSMDTHLYQYFRLKFTKFTRLSRVKSVECGLPAAMMDTPAILWKHPASSPLTVEARQPTTRVLEYPSASRSMFAFASSFALGPHVLPFQSSGSRFIITSHKQVFRTKMKGTEVLNPRHSSACDCTCVLTKIDHCLVTLSCLPCAFCFVPAHAKFAHKFFDALSQAFVELTFSFPS